MRTVGFYQALLLGVILVCGSELVQAERIAPQLVESRRIVVTPTRMETELEEVSGAITVISKEEIERRGQPLVLDLLRTVPGIEVVRSGGAGGNATVFIRGGNPEHTLVLIDGIEANNPITPGRAFDFATLTTDNIERIEILRGPQSTLYGSDALAGVINIITYQGRGPASAMVSSEAGSFGTSIYRGQVSGGTDIFSYSLGASYQETEGVSAAAGWYGNDERDGFRSKAVSSRLGLAPVDELELSAVLRYIDSKADLDDRGGPSGDNPERYLDRESLFTRAEARLNLFERKLQQTWGVSYSDQRFEDVDPPGGLSSATLDSRYVGKILKGDLQNNLYVSELATLSLGFESKQETGESYFFSEGVFGPFESRFPEQTARTNAVYGQVLSRFSERLISTFGARLDRHSEFGSKATWKVSSTYFIVPSSTSAAFNIGSGFKAPSLFQLYSDFGNQELSPERSLGVDLSLRQNFADGKGTATATAFYNEFDNLITFDPATFIYENISQARVRGAEFSTSYDIAAKASLGASYTYTETKDRDSRSSLLRRARNRASASFNFSPTEKSGVSLNYVFVGTRPDTDFSVFPPERVSLSSYSLLNLTARYLFTDNIELNARLDNLLDERYEEVLGFGTQGFGAYGGVRFLF
jgi:vitamin B12 transporter